MKPFRDAMSHLGPKTDNQKGVAFVLTSVVIFGLLIIAERPHWAGPWFIASLFTFALWRLNRQQAKG